jgi:phosphomannomutase
MDKIKFGTDGWRGVIAEDFTFANVRRVAAAVASYVREESEPKRGLIVGYDMRFLSAGFAQAVAETIAAAGIPVWLANAGTPTPAVSYAVVARKSAGAVMITASHNPYRWNGIKFKAPYGGSAEPAIIKRIEPTCIASTVPAVNRASPSRPPSSSLTSPLPTSNGLSNSLALTRSAPPARDS